MLFRIFAVLIGLSACFQAGAAIDPYEFSTDDELRRYQKFVEELRCPKCKNNNLAGTNSQIAADLRRELQKMVVDGKTDEQIIDFMVSRYGDFVLYRPRMQGKTLFVWLGPWVLFAIGLSAVVAVVVHRRKIAPVAIEKGLSQEEEEQLQALLASADTDRDSELEKKSHSDTNTNKKN